MALVAVVGLFVLGASASSEAAPPVRVAEPVAFADGFRIEAMTTYALDPGKAVHVALDITITNQRPNQVEANGVRTYYLPNFSVPVLAEAVGLRATKSSGTTLPVSVEPSESPRFSYAVVDLQPDLYYPQSQTFRLTYDLPPQAPRSESSTRLNEAYATFVMIAIGDPGLAGVELSAPADFEVELVGDDMQESKRDGRQVFTATAIDAPGEWSVMVSARDDTKLVERVVDVGDQDVKVLGWPDDAAWADFVATQVEDGVPALEQLTGLDWPATDTLDVIETASPYLYGYAGWYVRNDGLIEIGDELDQQVILHELAHVWFNDSLFSGRWINEGFADQSAALAMAAAGVEQPQPEAIAAGDPGRLKLNDWSDPDLQAEVSDDQERYGYNASWAVLDAITDEIGVDGFTKVIRAAEAGEVAYRGPGDPEELARTFDWRELLDLFEEVGGSAEAAGLFQRHVVSEAESADFDARTVARGHYAELLDAGEGWAAPTSIRLAMADWRFESAEELMTAATDVLATKADLLDVVADLDVSEDLALEASYEQATDLSDLAAEADDAVAAAEALRGAEDAEADGAGPLGAVGLLFSSVENDLTAAQDSFEAGDYAAVEEGAAEVEAAMDGAADGRGTSRARGARRGPHRRRRLEARSSPAAPVGRAGRTGRRRGGGGRGGATSRWR